MEGDSTVVALGLTHANLHKSKCTRETENRRQVYQRKGDWSSLYCRNYRMINRLSHGILRLNKYEMSSAARRNLKHIKKKKKKAKRLSLKFQREDTMEEP